jgi:hypothetical protein
MSDDTPSPHVELGTMPITFCKRCGVDVAPVGKGSCPHCRSFLKLNFVGRKHPINILRREQLLNKLVDEFKPDSVIQHAMCETLAGVFEQLESTRAGSPEHQRLAQLQQQIGSSLEESRAARIKPAAPQAEVTLDGLLARAETIRAALLALRDGSPQPVDAPGLETTIVVDDDDEFILIPEDD